MTPEGKVKQEIKDTLMDLQTQGDLRFFMPQNMGMGESGVADFVGVFMGRAFAIESKREDGTTHCTPWQWRFLCDWREASGLCGVARSRKDVIEILSMGPPNDRPIDPLQPNRAKVLS